MRGISKFGRRNGSEREEGDRIKISKGKNQGVAQLYTFALSWWLATQPSRGAQGHHWSRLALVNRESDTPYAALIIFFNIIKFSI